MPSLPGHEIIGTRMVGEMPPVELVDMWIRVTSAVVKHGFEIRYRDLEPPRTGTFNGLHIVLDPDVDFEMQCFILLHLFGHSVQWVAPALQPKLKFLQCSDDKEEFLMHLRDYEFEAARIGMRLLHSVGVTQLDQWYSDFVETDWRYVERFYREGEIPPWEECRASGCPVITPCDIPELEHREVEVRFAF